MSELEKDVSEKQASTTCWKVKADGGGHSTWQGTGSMSECLSGDVHQEHKLSLLCPRQTVWWLQVSQMGKVDTKWAVWV